MKDETANDEILISVNVCAKIYAYLKQINDNNGFKEEKKAKDIKKSVKKQRLKFQI